MVACYLCLEECGSVNKDAFTAIESLQVVLPIEIYSEEGIQLNIAELINKHLGLQPNKTEKCTICFKCWQILNEFHKFYQHTLSVHESLASKTKLFINTQDVDLDPLPTINVPIKLEKTIDEHSLTPTDNNFFDTEIKVEVNDLELLPQAEIIEDNSDVCNTRRLRSDFQVKTEIVPQKRGRGRPRKYSIIIPEKKRCNSESSNTSEDNGGTASNSGSDYSAKLKKKKSLEEEAARKKEQQLEYDRVLAKFFDKFDCPKCGLLFSDFSEIRKHFRSAHQEGSGYLSCCNRKFHQRKTLVEHVYIHWNPEHFKCSTCERVCQDGRSLEVHELTHSNGQNVNKDRKVFQCDKCPRGFASKAAFVHHSFSKHVPRSEFQFNCKECNKKLPTARKLKEHIKYMHNPESAIICDKCGKQMRSQSNLKKHHLTEHSDVPRPPPEPVQCEICGTWLRHLAGLKQHMKTIHEESGGEHRCHICNKTSTNSRALKRHIYHNHKCERKFKCTMCEKAFKRPQDLREHTSTHTGEVLYTCPNCPMTFFSNANMYKHRQRLHRAEWEEDKKQPRPPNIMQRAVGATAAMKKQLAVGATSAFFARKNETQILNANTNAN